jgi:hypothetical protein
MPITYFALVKSEPNPRDEGKDPAKVAAGRAGMRARWAGHEPRTVRLDSLPPAGRTLVMALIRAAREMNEPAAVEMPTGSNAEVSHAGQPTA